MIRSFALGSALALLSACTIPFGSAPPETPRVAPSPAMATGAPAASTPAPAAAPAASPTASPTATGGAGLAAAAAARGVRFLGRGNEPGWRVEVGPGDLVRVVHHYGTVRADFPGVTARTLPNGDTVHEGASGAHSLRLTLRPARCTDDMSGEVHPVTVLLRFDGEERRGCGGPIAGQ
ncbi:hypothetical protein [Quisquiliibacterium transsilvanicum]|uniref:Putative membrane protein n=1 Tax=Quisquiliibacterium transsilvanicum TaxID=1549638 RepID=A0A7W8HFH7_9BURK|nr:hypothetical protein [Quisquiliibacterium transsilvanicum]MBB5271159.1 putative membrane protein [Quisquiliibacterium transsilvanicum]